MIHCNINTQSQKIVLVLVFGDLKLIKKTGVLNIIQSEIMLLETSSLPATSIFISENKIFKKSKGLLCLFSKVAHA